MLYIVMEAHRLFPFFNVSDCEFRTFLSGTTKLEYDMYCNIKLELCNDSVDNDEYDNSHGINKIVDNCKYYGGRRFCYFNKKL